MENKNRKNTPDRDDTSEIMSWVIIFICMIVFWPIGLLLLLKKLNVFTKSKKHATGWANGNMPNRPHYNNNQHNRASQNNQNYRSTQYHQNQTGNNGQQNNTGYYSTRNSNNAGQQNRGTSSNTNQSARDVVREAETVAREVASDIARAAREVGSAARQAFSDAQIDVKKGTWQNPMGKSGTWQSATSQSPAWQSMGTKPGQSTTTYSANKQTTTQSQRQPGSEQASVHSNTDASQQAPHTHKEKSKIKKERTQLEKKTGKFVSVVLLLIAFALFALGANTIIGAARDIWGLGLSRWTDFYLGIFLVLGGFISFFSRNIGVKRLSRYKRYFVYVSDRDIVPISEIALTAGVSQRTVKRDIQAMINEGYLNRDAYIDKQRNCLVMIPDPMESVKRTESGAVDVTAPITAETPENQYMAIIQELREINYAIVDYPISSKIDRIEEVTAKIFRIVEEDPEKLPQIRRFMNYYLPTTLKLLRSYATLEKQGISGENITSAKESIESVLDTLTTGYEQQLDQLFRTDALDIAADINVLENLMQQDGLTTSKSQFQSQKQDISTTSDNKAEDSSVDDDKITADDDLVAVVEKSSDILTNPDSEENSSQETESDNKAALTPTPELQVLEGV